MAKTTTSSEKAIRKDLSIYSMEQLQELNAIVNVSLEGLKNDFELVAKTIKEMNKKVDVLNQEKGYEFAKISTKCPIFKLRKDKDNKAQMGFVSDTFDKKGNYVGIIISGYGIKLKINFGASKKDNKNTFTFMNKKEKKTWTEADVKRANQHKNAELEYCKALNLDTISEDKCKSKIAFGLFKNLETYTNQVMDAINALA